MKLSAGITSLALLIGLAGCKEDAPGHPKATGTSDWNEDSHGDVAANYDMVFDASSVLEIHIQIGAEDYLAMQDDMTDLAGELGADPGLGEGAGGDDPPPELFEACVDLAVGDPCEASLGPVDLSGFCFQGPYPELFCLPDGFLPEEPEDLVLLERDPIYVPVEVSVGDETWSHVGMRYKGNSSLAMSWAGGVMKLPFRLDFDKFEDEVPETKNQRFFGFDKLTFASGFSDDSLVRDALVADILDEQGVPVARYRFASVIVDIGAGSMNYGLYTMIEDPADAMAERIFGDNDGNVYKPAGLAADWTEFHEEGFPKKNNESDADWSDVEAAIDALHSPADDDIWREQLDDVFDADGFIRWLAVNTYVGNWDAYGVLAHNYYLFSDPETGVLHWVPWDHNLALADIGQGAAFGSPPSMSLDEITADWPLIRFLMDDPIYRDRYLDAVAEVGSGLASPAAFEERLRAHHDLIAPYVETEVAPYSCLSSQEAFEGSVSQLVDYVASRQVFADEL